MEIFHDLKFWTLLIGGLTLAGTIFNSIYQYLSHQKIVGNDLHHLSIDIKEIKTEQSSIKNKVISLAEDVSYLKGVNTKGFKKVLHK